MSVRTWIYPFVLFVAALLIARHHILEVQKLDEKGISVVELWLPANAQVIVMGKNEVVQLRVHREQKLISLTPDAYQNLIGGQHDIGVHGERAFYNASYPNWPAVFTTEMPIVIPDELARVRPGSTPIYLGNGRIQYQVEADGWRAAIKAGAIWIFYAVILLLVWTGADNIVARYDKSRRRETAAP